MNDRFSYELLCGGRGRSMYITSAGGARPGRSWPSTTEDRHGIVFRER